MNQSPFLTIAIPTYNRCHHLEKRIAELKPQLVDGVQIIVFDNASEDNTHEFMYSCKNDKNIFYKRSVGNLGMTGNFIKCISESNSQWVWVLGDDDGVLPNCIETILSVVKNTSSSIVNFTTHACFNPQNQVINNLKELLNIKDVTSLLHFSSNIYLLEKAKKAFPILASSSVTYAMHVALILRMIESIPNTSIELRKDKILCDDPKNPRRWSSAEVSMGLSLFPLFIKDDELKKLCAIQLRSSTRWMLLWALGDLQYPNELKNWKNTVQFTNYNLSFFGGNLLNHIAYVIFNSNNYKDLARDFKIFILNLLPSVFLWKLSQKSKLKSKNIREKVLSEF